MGNLLDPEAATPQEGDSFILGARGVSAFAALLWVLLSALLLQLAFSVYLHGLDYSQMAGIAAMGVILITQQLLRRGYAKAAGILFCWSSCALVVVQCFIVAGVRTPGLFYAPTICVIAIWLSGFRHALAITGVFVVTILGFAAAETLGHPIPAITRSPATLATLTISGILMTLVVTMSALNSFKFQLGQISQLTQAQAQQLIALKRSEERFSALFKANPTPSSTVDEEGRTKDVNDAWVALFGISADQARNKTTRELGLWSDPEDSARVLAEYASKGRVVAMPVNFETASGTRAFHLYIAPVEFNGMQRLVTSLVDQTDRLAAEAAQRAQHEMLERRVAERTTELSQTVARLTATQEELVQSEKLASLGAMVAGISHELNTPIGNTVTVSSTLHARIQDFRKLVDAGQLRKSDLVEFLGLMDEMSDVIVRSTRRAAELVTSFKQVAVDRSSERRREFDVAILTQELVMALKPSMRKHNVEVNLDIPAGITCDSFPGPVGQVITNLIQNALTHAFGEGGSGTISIRATTEGHLVVMTIRDDGLGMDEHTLKHAFDPFFTTRLGQGGSGLGLSVSHRIAHTVLGGTLTAVSTPGQGSCFTFSFLRQLPHES